MPDTKINDRYFRYFAKVSLLHKIFPNQSSGNYYSYSPAFLPKATRSKP